MALTFKGGAHINEHKLSAACPVEALPEPPFVRISLSQGIGAPASPSVSVGDSVALGDVIGDVPADSLGCPVHASISGTVTAIEECRIPGGALERFVVIENDMLSRVSDSLSPFSGSISSLSPDELCERVRRAGIVGMGGAAFPTYAKINSARGRCSTLIVNCAECEPFITADHRLLLERPEAVLRGLKLLLRAVGASEAVIAVEDNKLDAVDRLRELCGKDSPVSVKVLRTKYPQGDERQLIFALTGRELGEGKLPADAGCVIFNAHTCAAVYDAFSTGMPCVRRIVTVSGDCVASPKNLYVPLGVSAEYLLGFCGGLTRRPEKLISGGPMMGRAVPDASVTVKKGTSSFLFLSEEFSRGSVESVCIHCGRCISTCPMHLMPVYLAQFVRADDMKSAELYGALSCVECGTCSHGCPAKIELVQYIRVAKGYIRTERARMRAAEEASRAL